MKSTDSEPQGGGMELEQYRTSLEQMVEEKSKDLIAIQENLEATNRRQALFIKVLQILQLEPDIPTAMNMALAEIGRYTDVDRLATWENHLDGVTYGCTNEWCNDGIEPAIDYLRSMTIEAGKPWFDMLEENHIICTSDIYSLDPFITQMLEVQGVKAIAVFPLSQLGVHFGFLSFNFCWNKQWDEKDVELMSQISQIVSTATKRWQVETSLQQSQRTMQKVLDNINANIFVSDYDTLKVIFANKPFREEAGEVPANAECWRMLNAGLENGCKHCPKPKLLDANRKFTGVHFWEDYNPVTKRWYTIQSMAIKWLDGRWAIMELATDITTRKQVELELIQAKEKAEESDRLKSAFLANMSHEIRTPLNAIVGFSRIIAESTDAEERQDYYDIVEANNERLLQLINEILDLSKIEAGMVEFTITPVRLHPLCKEIHDALKFRCPEGVELVYEASDEEIVVEGDKNRIFQVISNLIGNAFKFTTRGSVGYGYRRKGNGIEFYVSDTGIGIQTDKLAKVFERFVKVNTFAQGTGLGLSICKTIIERLGGTISVCSEVGKGTTFTFTLPLAKDKRETAEEQNPVSETGFNTPGNAETGNNTYGPDEETHEHQATQTTGASQSTRQPTILIAEDTDSNYILVKAILGKSYHLERAKDGMEAVTMFEELHPDLILMDMKMPNLNGLDATKIIRELSPGIPIIALTAYAYEHDRQAALDAGCNDFLTKPYTQEILKELINKYLKQTGVSSPG